MSTASGPGRILPIAFFDREADLVARDLLGALVRSEIGGRVTSGMIVEVEAYLGAEDPASHAYGMRLNRGNRSIYSEPGTWYVYRSYGIHWCANLVCAGPAPGSAVLIRALQPLGGVATMAARRGRSAMQELCSGPGKLTQALGIDRELDGTVMSAEAAVTVVRDSALPAVACQATGRIGITKAADWPLRYAMMDSPWVSRPSAKARSPRAQAPS